MFKSIPFFPTLHFKIYLRIFVPLVSVVFAWYAHASPSVFENPTSPTSRVFLAAPQDLATFGYVEKEYVVSGVANVYEYDDNQDVKVKLADQPYATRIIVRRPENASDANGNVIIEWLNPSAGFDSDPVWHTGGDLEGGGSIAVGDKPGYYMRNGITYVGISIKPITLQFLRFAYAFGDGRYDNVGMTDLGQAYDMVNQIAALLRDQGNPENPINDIRVKSLVHAGVSQSSAYLITHANEFDDINSDGYWISVIWGAQPLNNAIPLPVDEYLVDDRRFIKKSVDAKVIRVQSETEVFLSTTGETFGRPFPSNRQRDNRNFRYYEVAGSSHAQLDALADVFSRDLGFPFVLECDSKIPSGEDPRAFREFQVASIDNLFRWTRADKHRYWRYAPKKMRKPISLVDSGFGYQEIERDEFGNAIGGIKLPGIAAPLASYFVPNTGGPFCLLIGAMQPFSQEEVDAIYPSEQAYLRKHHRNLLRSLIKGFILPEDAWSLFLSAEERGTGFFLD